MSEDLTKKFPKTSAGNFDELFQLIQSVRAELSEFRKTVETRLYDTRPIWEKVVSDIAKLQEGQVRLEEGQVRLEEGQVRLEEGQVRLEEGQVRLEEGQVRLEEGQVRLQQDSEAIRGEVREIRTHLRDMDRRLSIFNDTLVGIQADYRDIYDRVRVIERQRS